VHRVFGLDARTRFNRFMRYRDVDRPPFYEWLGYWRQTVDRWYGEGLPPGVNVEDFFGFDRREGVPVDYDPIPSFIPKLIEEDDRYIVWQNTFGIVCRDLKVSTSMPNFIEFPVKKPSDWDVLKPRFNPHDPRRLPKYWGEELFEYYRSLTHPLAMGFIGFFGFARNLMGLQRLLIAFYRDPELVRDIMDHWAWFCVEMAKTVLGKVKVDYATIWEDMSYNRGPHISPRLFEEFMLPCYRRLTSTLRSLGVDLIMVDTDGNFEALIPLFIEGGVNCFYPLEAAAYMDAVKLRKEYGRDLRLIGNVDKRALAAGFKTIDREIERVKPLIEEGGYIVSVDHCVSADIPFKHYAYYIDKIKKMYGLS
jgi:uroporphyrinogen decarboxylase